MNDFIKINGLTFHAFHGHLPEEQLIGNTFIVDLKIEVNLKTAGISDNLNDTVDYCSIMEIVSLEMKTSSNLIEHVAERIAENIKTKHKKIISIEVTIKKQKPPLCYNLKGVEVTIKR